MNSTTKSIFNSIVKFLIAAVIIVWMVKTGRFELSSLKSLLTLKWISLCLILALANIAINNYRWLLLLKSQSCDASHASTLNLTFIGLFFNFAMPGGVGGDFAKIYYLIKDYPQARMVAATSVVMDRFIGFFGMVLVSFIALLLHWPQLKASPQFLGLFALIGGLFLAFVLFFGIAFSRRFQESRRIRKFLQRLPYGDKFLQFYYVVHSYGRDVKTVLISMLLSFFSLSSAVALCYIAAIGLGYSQIPLSAFIFCVPVGIVAMAIPIAPAGIGVGQAAFYALFVLYLGFETQAGAAIVTAYQAGILAWGLVGALVYLKRKQPINNEEPA
jgi:uncharacterized protein (TIRG00374 family)